MALAAAWQSYEEKDSAMTLSTTYPEGLHYQRHAVHVEDQVLLPKDEEIFGGDNPI